MRTSEIRRRYLDYFVGQGHLELPSAPLVPYDDDPTVLLTIAGMQPLKSFFMGTAAPPAPRMTSSQKCFRTVDIDQVGYTARHLTFFEMLGNFSIGDYFKDDAIRFAWEFSTDVLGLDPDKIWITVFEGMPGVPADDEAIEKWVDVGVPRDRIQALGESENFWKAGPTGPCGPNTELYLDRGPEFGPDGGPAVGGDRFLEYWNLVFMQYERAASGELSSLPAKNIDTGAGLERIAAILQDTPSVYETDGFRPLIAWAEEQGDVSYGAAVRTDRALRVMADHGRAMSFLAGDGVRPGNEGRAYVMRRIVRRAVAEAGQIGIAPDRVPDLANVVADGWGDTYPELRDNLEEIRSVIGAEAEQFARTLTQGRALLADVIASSAGGGLVSGDDAFRLYDTYGFPLDLTKEAAGDAGLQVDEGGFDALMTEQRERSRSAVGQGAGESATYAAELAATAAQTTFVGYERLEATTEVTASDGERGLVKLAESPFYAEGGGQISDAGEIIWEGGSAPVTGVFRIGDDQVLQVDGAAPVVGATVAARVDAARRRATQANHTATHVLNWALRERLGDSVRQAGSYVGPDKLRFDFTHVGKVPSEELHRIEAMVNERVLEDQPVAAEVVARDAAAQMGAIGLFEEKYGEQVRVLSAGDFSKELCGGTHVSHLGEIGSFRLVSETSTGAGARRIEALTGPGAIEWFREREQELLDELDRRDRRVSELEAELKQARSSKLDVAAIASGAKNVGPALVLATEVEAPDMEALLALSDQLRDRLGSSAAILLGSRAGDRAFLAANLGPDAVAAGLSAADIIGVAAPIVGGGGGGKERLARAGGKEPARLPEAILAAEQAVLAGLEDNGRPAPE